MSICESENIVMINAEHVEMHLKRNEILLLNYQNLKVSIVGCGKCAENQYGLKANQQ